MIIFVFFLSLHSGNSRGAGVYPWCCWFSFEGFYFCIISNADSFFYILQEIFFPEVMFFSSCVTLFLQALTRRCICRLGIGQRAGCVHASSPHLSWALVIWMIHLPNLHYLSLFSLAFVDPWWPEASWSYHWPYKSYSTVIFLRHVSFHPPSLNFFSFF